MVGQNIGKYRVLDRIGRGGMGTVYRAIDETLHRDVAIKVLNAELNDPEVAKRFRAEAITVARLSHPGIATIYELFQHEGQWLMVMEFVRGETLEHMVDRMGPISPQRAAELSMQTLAALAHAHSMGVVHRDLKPANLMITETGAIKIMDFGIARVTGTEHLTSAGFMMGTPAYMAPEQVMGREIDARADLYSLGVVFFRLTTAKLPFKGDTPFAMAQSQVNDPPTPIGMFRTDLPPWVEPLVTKSLAKNVEERFQSAIELHEAFARCLAGLPMAAAYSSSAPTELMMTPPRAMPTGALYRSPTPQPTSYPAPMPAPAATGSSAAAAPAPPSSAWADPGLAQTMLSGTQNADALSSPPSPAAASSTSPIAAPSFTSPVAVPPAPSMTGATPAVTQTAPVAGPSTGPIVGPPTSATPAVTTTGATPAAGPQGTVAAPAAAAKKSPSSSSPMTAIVVAAVVLLALGGVGAWWWATHRTPPSEVTTVQATPEAPVVPPPSSTDIPAPDPGGATAPGAPAAPAAPTTPATAATASAGDTSRGTPPAGTRGATVTPPPAGSGTAGAASTVPATGRGTTDPNAAAAAAAAAAATPARGATGRPAPTFDDTHEVFQDVKVIVVNGKRGSDRDVILSFGNGQVGLLGGAGGAALAAVPYRSITNLTYVHARDPRWQEADSAPPKDLDVGSFIRTAKHWLVLQSPDRYVILRLEDKNVRAVLDTFSTRTGLTINRPQTNEKN